MPEKYAFNQLPKLPPPELEISNEISLKCGWVWTYYMNQNS